MAYVRNDQYLHRPTAGRGAITAQDPLEVLLHSGGQPISGTNRLPVEATLTGQLKGLSTNRPAANSVAVGTVYWSVDTGDVSVSTGTDWRSLGVV